MTRITKGVSLALFLSAVGGPLWAGSYTANSCNESDVNAVIHGPTHTAVAGDTIIIPAGTCTWNSGVTITVGITLTGSGTVNTTPSSFGAGTTNTIIVDNYGGGPVISVQNITTGQTARISLLDIEPVSTSAQLVSPIQVAGVCNSSGCPNMRIDNIVFGKTTQWTEGGNGAQADSMIRTDNVFGVIDHNTVPTGAQSTFANIQHSAYLGVGAFGDNSWAQPDSFGGPNNVFLENNSLYNALTVTDTEFPPNGGAVGGARLVGRFNQVHSVGGSFEMLAGHGLDTDGRPQSVRHMEGYKNTITCTGGSCNTAVVAFRGGTGFVFGNTITANFQATGGYYNAVAAFSIYRTVFAAGGGWGACGGSSPYDTNEGVASYSGTMTASNGSLTMTDSSKSWTTNQLSPRGAPYSVYDTTQGFWSQISSNTSNTITISGPISESGWTGFNNGDSYQIRRATVCVNQGGRGAGNYVSGTPPSPAAALSQALDPVYEFADSFSGSLNQGYVTGGGTIMANRDWYTDNGAGQQTSSTSPFNGSSGVGWGTLANRPSTCTPHVGYWVTDQGNWNQSGAGGQGELFVCTSTNTWGSTPYYTPYTYPHPLTQGTGNQITGNPPPPPPPSLPGAPTSLQATVK